MIEVISSGNSKNLEEFLKRTSSGKLFIDLDHYGEMGVQALSSATPEDTGLTAESWGYRILRTPPYFSIEWFNRNQEASGTPVAILIQYGHGTGTGGYVVGRDFINSPMKAIFDTITEEIWKKVIA